MAAYRTCPHCGANLDPGEACDCKESRQLRWGTPQPEKPHAGAGGVIKEFKKGGKGIEDKKHRADMQKKQNSISAG